MGLLRNRGGTDAVHPQQFIREEGDSIPEQTETPVLMNLGVASELDIDAEQVRDVLAAVAPIVGTARVVSATSKIMRALELDLLEIEAETEEEA